MKKSLVLLATAALFAACSENDLIVDNFMSGEAASQESAIGFGSGMNNMIGTKAENSDATGTNGLENFWYTMRIWGYKNIATSTANVFTSTPVFNATINNDLYSKSIATWTDKSKLAAPFYTSENDWYYSPVRYWDKTATSYDFHAAAPDTLKDGEPLAWEWTQKGATSSTNQTDGKGNGYFTLADFTLVGESLPIGNDVANGTDAVFGGKKGTGTWTDKDVDLMIADDICKEIPTNHTLTTNEHVNFHFNHILSRLNIGIKIGNQVAVKYKQIDAEGGKKEDDLANPTEGIVLLQRVQIVNLNTKGTFDEGVLEYVEENGKPMNGKNDYITAEALKAGTSKRWTSSVPTTLVVATPTDNVKYGFPNEKVTGALDGDNDAFLNLTKQFTVTAANTVTGKDITFDNVNDEHNKFKMIFQGLVIPQDAQYEDVAIDGSNITSATAPYLKIEYTLDDEQFTNYYNLAAIFSKYNDEYKATINSKQYYAYKTDKDNVYAYSSNKSLDESLDESTFVDKNEQELAIVGYQDAVTRKYYVREKSGYNLTDNSGKEKPGEDGIILMCNATGNADEYTISLIKPTRGEADKAGIAADECTLSFNEGWQNNLWITINPTAILFDADVYQWATYTQTTDISESNLTVE